MDQYSDYRLPRWEELPVIPLYMDQVVLVLNDGIGSLAADSQIKPTMVNNYVKHKVLPPPEKKKYDRDRLSRLVIISILKRALTIGEIAALMQRLSDKLGMEAAYNLFANRLEQTLQYISAGEALPICREGSDDYLDAAMISLAGKLLVEQYLQQSKDAQPPVNNGGEQRR